MKTRSQEKQLAYLSQSARLREASSPAIVRATLTSVSLSTLAFLAWAAFADVHEIAHTPGEIVPSGYQQVVQNLDGGVVRDILVKEGEVVDKGQPLMHLDGAGAEEDLARARDQQLLLGMQEERLRAFIEKRPTHFAPEALAKPDLVRDQEAFFNSMTASKNSEAAVMQDQILQKKQSITSLSADLETARSNFVLAQRLHDRESEMFARGVMTETRLLESEQNYNMLSGQIRSLQGQIAVARSAIAEYQNRLASLSSGGLDDVNQKLDAILAARAQNAEQVEKLQKRVDRLTVRSPAHGTIKGLAVNTVGGVVQPGQVLAEIVPADAPLIVSVKIPPRYIGHLAQGQKVQVKVSSFDFSRYGSITGKLDFVSAATFTGENGERYFQGRVLLDHPYVGENPSNAVMPGMTVMADIITGSKTVLQYLLKPIRNALSTAFTER